MSNDRLKNALGLSMRAGKCVLGDFAAEKAVKGGKVRLLVLDAAASPATKARYAGFCERGEIPLILCEGAGQAVGRPGGRIIAVLDQGFAAMIEKAANDAANKQDGSW